MHHLKSRDSLRLSRLFAFCLDISRLVPRRRQYQSRDYRARFVEPALSRFTDKEGWPPVNRDFSMRMGRAAGKYAVGPMRCRPNALPAKCAVIGATLRS
ncbi:hypothetical protein [Achromobacter dolens]|uniref:hypothetical protein n=1 Tax=Achromobacter dolens TaxID=1287738 RepID=UPI0012E1D47B|nr:hypothetical protein [Achromobacter dolens]